MSIPDWILKLCCDSYLHLDDTPTHDQLNQLSTFLQSIQSTRINAIHLVPTISNATVETILKCLRKNSMIHTLRILVSKQHVADSSMNEWFVTLNQAPPSIILILELYDDVVIQPWIRALQLNTNITILQILNSPFGPSDVNELIDLLSSNSIITALTLNLRRMKLDSFFRFCAHLKSDHFIKSLIVDYDYEPVRDGDAIALTHAIKSNKILTSLTLTGRRIRSFGRSSFADALNYNSTLVSLDLPSQDRDDDYHKLITARLQRNRSLIHNPLELLLRQTELTKETDRLRTIKQSKLESFMQAHQISQTKEDNQARGDQAGPVVARKPVLELVSSSPSQMPSMSVRLNEYEVEYLRVRLDFHESFACMPDYHGLKFNVTQIERITNSVLKKQFDQSYQYFMTNEYHSTQPIRSVYHSTKPKNIPNILQSNLTLAKAGSMTDSGWFGNGMYFSPHADYTLMYYSTGHFKRVSAGDSGKILQFDILPGRMLTMTNVKVGGVRTPYYDSHVSPNEFEYVMFDSRHILPRYIISFQVVQGAGAKFTGSMEQVGH